MVGHLLGTRPCAGLRRDADEPELAGLTALPVLRISRLWQDGCYRRGSKGYIPWQVLSMREERSGGGREKWRHACLSKLQPWAMEVQLANLPIIQRSWKFVLAGVVLQVITDLIE